MLIVDKAADRGRTTTSWLESYHSFSFGDWYDPKRMGYGVLRVLNDDTIAPGKGFGAHSHKNMEIVTIVLSGALEHQDSTGGHGIIRAGEVQHMSAGTGIVHSEYNASENEPVCLLQIWISPERDGISPAYSQKGFPLTQNVFTTVVDHEALEGALKIHQRATFLLGEFEAGKTVSLPSKSAYVFVISGGIFINDHALDARDGAAVSNEDIMIRTGLPSKVLVIDMS